jgi:hypothetical protein
MTKTKIRDDDNDAFDSNGRLKDGRHATVPMFMKDGKTLNPDLSPAQRVAAAVAATRQAMNSFDSSMHRMHRPGFRYAADAVGFTADSAAAAVVARDAAYESYDRRQSDAWRGKTRDAPPPEGGYSADDYSEGDQCTVNGSPGKLVASDDSDDWLICVADDGSTDDSAKTPQQIKDAAYQSYQDDIENAWRRK